MSWQARIRPLAIFSRRRRAIESELDEELRSHLEMEQERLIAAGRTPEQAHREARLTFGSVERFKEECREERSSFARESFSLDLLYAARALRSRPGYLLGAVVTLALGIGANVAVGTVLHAVLLRPLPYQDAERLVALTQEVDSEEVGDLGFSPPEIRDLQAGVASFEGFTEYHSMWFNLLGRGEPQRVQTGVVSAEHFDVLGVRPLLGRAFAAGDEVRGAEPVLVLSHDFWQRLGADPSWVGETVEMNDRVHTIIGVLPPLPQYPGENDVYMPSTSCPFRNNERVEADRTARGYTVFARLRPSVSVERARADLEVIGHRFRGEHPEAYVAGITQHLRLTPVFERLAGPARPTLLLLLATSLLVLLTAMANVANLDLARALTRTREFALRASLGAPRGRLLRQLMLESTMVALLAGVAGTTLAVVLVPLLARFAARFSPRAAEVSLGVSGLALAAGLAVLVGLALGAVAAAQVLRGSSSERLKPSSARSFEGGPRTWLRKTLVVAQVAVSIVLLLAAGLLIHSLLRLQEVDPGFEPRGVVAARIDLDWARYRDASSRRTFWQSLMPRLAALPGVEKIGFASEIPLSTSNLAQVVVHIEGRDNSDALAAVSDARVADAGYLGTLEVPLLAGRLFSESDGPEAPPVALINRALARRHWGEASPLGARISLDRGQSWLTVVGVVGDVHQRGLAEPVRGEVYTAFPQTVGLSAQLLLRTERSAAALEGEIRQVVRALDSRQPIAAVQSLEEVRRGVVAPPRLIASLLAIFAALTLAITVAGLAALMAFTVHRRRHELGVRLALGAARGSVLSMLLREGLVLVVVGLVCGGIVGLGATGIARRALGQLLFGVTPFDPATAASACILLFGTAALACLLPAARALAIDPIETLRCD